MTQVFVSYRRDDSAFEAALVRNSLEQGLGSGTVFMDVDNIPLGVDFREHLNAAVQQCQIVVAVIGKHWLGTDASGTSRRIDDARDFVRVEIEAALVRGIPVVPLLVGSAKLPSPDQLPLSIRDIAFRNAAILRPGRDLDVDLDGLRTAIQRHLGFRHQYTRAIAVTKRPWLRPVFAVTLIGVLLSVGTFVLALWPAVRTAPDPRAHAASEGAPQSAIAPPPLTPDTRKLATQSAPVVSEVARHPSAAHAAKVGTPSVASASTATRASAQSRPAPTRPSPEQSLQSKCKVESALCPAWPEDINPNPLKPGERSPWFVPLYEFDTREEAEPRRREIAALGFPTVVSRYGRNGECVIFIGPYATDTEAANAMGEANRLLGLRLNGIGINTDWNRGNKTLCGVR